MAFFVFNSASKMVSSPLVILGFILICVTLHCNSLAEAKANPRPNIVLILTDDLDVSIGGMVSIFSKKVSFFFLLLSCSVVVISSMHFTLCIVAKYVKRAA